MDLQAGAATFRGLRVRHESDTHVEQALPARGILRLWHLHDHHVAAVAATPVEVALGGGAVLAGLGRDALQDLIAERDQGVVETDLADRGVAPAQLDAED